MGNRTGKSELQVLEKEDVSDLPNAAYSLVVISGDLLLKKDLSVPATLDFTM
jgi:hypothetical protein